MSNARRPEGLIVPSDIKKVLLAARSALAVTDPEMEKQYLKAVDDLISLVHTTTLASTTTWKFKNWTVGQSMTIPCSRYSTARQAAWQAKLRYGIEISITRKLTDGDPQYVVRCLSNPVLDGGTTEGADEVSA